jgi:hypothetical protein
MQKLKLYAFFDLIGAIAFIATFIFINYTPYFYNYPDGVKIYNTNNPSGLDILNYVTMHQLYSRSSAAHALISIPYVFIFIMTVVSLSGIFLVFKKNYNYNIGDYFSNRLYNYRVREIFASIMAAIGVSTNIWALIYINSQGGNLSAGPGLYFTLALYIIAFGTTLFCYFYKLSLTKKS